MRVTDVPYADRFTARLQQSDNASRPASPSGAGDCHWDPATDTLSMANEAGDTWVEYVIGGSTEVTEGGTGFSAYTLGDLLVGNGSATLSKLPVSGIPNNYVLIRDSGQPLGVKWSAPDTSGLGYLSEVSDHADIPTPPAGFRALYWFEGSGDDALYFKYSSGATARAVGDALGALSQYYDPSAPPTSAHGSSDEFDNGVVSGWTTWDHDPTGITVSEDSHGLLLTTAECDNKVRGVYKSPPGGEWMLDVKFSLGASDLVYNTAYGGIALFEDATTSAANVVTLGTFLSQTSVVCRSYSLADYTALTGSSSSLALSMTSGYLRIAYTSLSAAHFCVSQDGLTFSEIKASAAYLPTLGHVGVILSHTASPGNSAWMRVRFARFASWNSISDPTAYLTRPVEGRTARRVELL